MKLKGWLEVEQAPPVWPACWTLKVVGIGGKKGCGLFKYYILLYCQWVFFLNCGCVLGVCEHSSNTVGPMLPNGDKTASVHLFTQCTSFHTIFSHLFAQCTLAVLSLHRMMVIYTPRIKRLARRAAFTNTDCCQR